MRDLPTPRDRIRFITDEDAAHADAVLQVAVERAIRHLRRPLSSYERFWHLLSGRNVRLEDATATLQTALDAVTPLWREWRKW